MTSEAQMEKLLENEKEWRRYAINKLDAFEEKFDQTLKPLCSQTDKNKAIIKRNEKIMWFLLLGLGSVAIKAFLFK